MSCNHVVYPTYAQHHKALKKSLYVFGVYVKHLGSLVFHYSNKLMIWEDCTKWNLIVVNPRDSICMKYGPHKLKSINHRKIRFVGCWCTFMHCWAIFLSWLSNKALFNSFALCRCELVQISLQRVDKITFISVAFWRLSMLTYETKSTSTSAIFAKHWEIGNNMYE